MLEDVELTEAYFFVLSVADEYMPGPEILDLLLGVHVSAGYEGESVTIFDALPPDEARQVTLELFDEGCLEVALLEDGERRLLAPDDARIALTDTQRWINAGQPNGPAFCVLSLTERGQELFARAREIFGDEIERRYEEANDRNAEFERPEPQWVREKNQWFEDWGRWIDAGFTGPEPPEPPKHPTRPGS